MSDPHPVDVVIQGFPGAAEVLYGFREVFDNPEFSEIVTYLAEYGPRGPNLYERFTERANRDVLVLGRDLLAQAGEQKGWEGGV